jgi:hypothetical protein
MIEEPGADGWLLVHGRLRYGPNDSEPSLHHAWIELEPDSIYDIGLDYVSRQAFRARYGRYVIDHKYNRREVCARHLAGQYAPWARPLLRTSAATFVACGIFS